MNRLAKSAITAAGLSLLFLVVYIACNQLSAVRSDVAVAYLEWERRIPFLPWLIVPYMSIDLFFVGAPFLASDDRERRVFAQRIAAAILVAGVFFLVMPLRFAFARPEVDGVLGVVFNHFREMDLPYNQFPSLHVALAWILVLHYAAHSRGLLRAVLVVWFALIAISTVFTYQHHAIDLVGGAVLGGWCAYLFPADGPATATTGNRRIAVYYGIGVALLVLAACLWRPWSLVLMWPALSLGSVALAYCGVGPAIYRKAAGRLPLATRLFHAPMLLGQALSLRHYARHSDPWNAVTDHVWLGRQLSDADAARAVAAGVTAVVDMTSEFSEPAAFRALPYLQIPVLDLTAPTPAQLQSALDFIAAHSADGVVYVHCKVGYSRSGTVVAAWLVTSGEVADADAAIARLQTARPGIVIRPEAVEAVRTFADRRG